MLNKGQKAALAALNSGRNIFLSGEAGTGKSYVLNHFLTHFSSGKNVIVCAPTGIAAINVGGSTLHRVFKVPLEPISPNTHPTKVSEIVEKADIIIIDEISMCRFDCFEFVAKAIKRAEKRAQAIVKQKAEKMGVNPKKIPAKQLIVVGDFFQLPPVITEKDRKVLDNYWGKLFDVGDGFAFQAPMWQEFHFTTIVLTEVIRQKDELEFVTNLNKMRRGDKSGIPWFNEKAAKQLQKGIHLCSTNKAAEQINVQEAAKINAKSKIYRSTITGNVAASDKATSDELELKEGLQVMVLVNDQEDRFQNGSIGIITKLHPNSVTVNLDGSQNIEICPNTWEIIDYEITVNENGESKVEKVVVGTFRQLPLKIAYAITIHKSQGQTFDAANISPGCFAPGQLYVALSRVKSIQNLHLTSRIQPRNLITSQAVLDFYDYDITTYGPIT